MVGGKPGRGFYCCALQEQGLPLLLFYDASGGCGEFFRLQEDCSMTLLVTRQPGWSSSWSHILPVRTGGKIGRVSPPPGGYHATSTNSSPATLVRQRIRATAPGCRGRLPSHAPAYCCQRDRSLRDLAGPPPRRTGYRMRTVSDGRSAKSKSCTTPKAARPSLRTDGHNIFLS